MNTIILSGFNFPYEIGQLFTEYTQYLIDNDPVFQDYLDQQNYEEELSHLKDKYSHLHILFCNDKAAGCIALKPVDECTCELKRFYVRPEFRGLGLGRILIDKVIDDARLCSYTTIRLDTLPFLKSALHLYKSYGFVETSSYNNSPMGTSIYMKLTL